MNLVDLAAYKESKKNEEIRPRKITFRSSKFSDDDGNDSSCTINVIVENGDVLGILDAVIEAKGVGQFTENGKYMFIPWPCAIVEISDLVNA